MARYFSKLWEEKALKQLASQQFQVHVRGTNATLLFLNYN